MYKIMISGPHAIGKSTTAENLAAKLEGYTYSPSMAGKIANELKYDLNDGPTPEQVLAYQKVLLESYKTHYALTREVKNVYDRSPLDFAAYTVMEIAINREYDEEVTKYLENCIKATDKYCDYLIIPFADLKGPYEDKDKRPKFTEKQIEYRSNYMEVVFSLIKFLKNTKVIFVPIDKQFDERVEYIYNKLELRETEDEQVS